MNLNNLAVEDQNILHTFDTIQKAKKCADIVSLVEGFPVVLRYDSGFGFGFEADNLNAQLQLSVQRKGSWLNNPDCSAYLHLFKEESREAVRWLYENFSVEHQAAPEFIYPVSDKSILYMYFKGKSTGDFEKDMLRARTEKKRDDMAFIGYILDREDPSIALLNQYLLLCEKKWLEAAVEAVAPLADHKKESRKI